MRPDQTFVLLLLPIFAIVVGVIAQTPALIQIDDVVVGNTSEVRQKTKKNSNNPSRRFLLISQGKYLPFFLSDDSQSFVSSIY